MVHIPTSVEGGIIVRDECGTPTGSVFSFSPFRNILISLAGVLLDNAQELVKKLPLTEEDLMFRFQTTVDKALSVGLTSIHDAGFDPTSLAFFKR